MLSFLGGGMICAVSSYCGFYLASRLEKRRDFLRGMRDALAFMRTEIAFAKNELGYIFSGLERSSGLCGFFKMCNESLKDCGIKAAWQAALDKTAEDVNLSPEDIRILKQLGQVLGMSDVKGQMSAIDTAVSHLNDSIATAEADCNRLCRVYRQCGVLLGIFILIIVI